MGGQKGTASPRRQLKQYCSQESTCRKYNSILTIQRYVKLCKTQVRYSIEIQSVFGVVQYTTFPYTSSVLYVIHLSTRLPLSSIW